MPNPQISAASQKRKNKILNAYGPKGQVVEGYVDKFGNDVHVEPNAAKEYNSIELPVPEGLTPEIVAMVAMGAAMDPEKYDYSKNMTDSSAGGDMTLFNQAFHYTNITTSDARSRDFSDILVDSRKEAQKALIAYQNGDKSLVNKHLKTLADHAKKNQLDHISLKDHHHDKDECSYEMKIILGDMLNNPNIDFASNFNETEKMKLKSAGEQVKAYDEFAPVEAKLLSNNPPPANSEERKKAAEDYLFGRMLSNTEYYDFNSTDMVYNDTHDIAKKYAESYAPGLKKGGNLIDKFDGFSSRSKDPVERKLCSKASAGSYMDSINALEKNYVSPLDTYYINGTTEKLKEKYLPLLRELPEYKQIVEAKDNKELSKAINNANNISFEIFKDTMPLDTTLSDELTKSGDSYKKQMEKVDHDMSHAVCFENAKYFGEKIKALDTDTTPELDKTRALLKGVYTDLKQLNEEYDYTKGPIINSTGYIEKIDNAKNISAVYDANLKAVNSFNENIELLNSTPKSIFQSGHQDSAEIRTLREKMLGLKELYCNFDHLSGNINDDPEYQQAAVEAYKASLAYQKKVAKGNFGKNGWEPSSDMGKDRFKGALAIEKLAMSIAPELIAKEMTLEEQRTQIESINNKNDFDNKYKETVEELNKHRSMHKTNNKPSPMEEFMAKHQIAQNLAKIIAIKTVNNKYESALKNGQIKEIDNSSLFSMDVQTHMKTIIERDDFQRMMQDNSVDDLINAATVKNGKGLMAKLGEAHIKVGKEKALEKIREKKANDLQMDKAPVQPKLK
ncbi:hypothetical protein [Ruminococcus sp. NK3A76]|uniref:hypothetical protein n=1 Tax=Ruminococcus sp. NK3A76 TaxID=877411 RepID=UPI00048B679B|nr:hypothetical protein [Ruminococcus sp. NK3A76]